MAIAVLMAIIGTACGQTEPEIIVSGHMTVTDGDTLKHGDLRIRLLGIDTCERGQTALLNGQEWDCYRAGKSLLETLTKSKRVDCTDEGRDRYQRLLSICYVDNTNLNQAMIESGLAVVYRHRGRPTYPAMLGFENLARSEKRGLWATERFIDPTDFRRSQR